MASFSPVSTAAQQLVAAAAQYGQECASNAREWAMGRIKHADADLDRRAERHRDDAARGIVGGGERIDNGEADAALHQLADHRIDLRLRDEAPCDAGALEDAV